jgi:hypothetical protein
MNKYQEALSNIRYYYAQSQKYKKLQKYNAKRQLETLQELVDKDTPKKPIQKAAGRTVCPNCERSTAREVSPRYCSICGQRLDWSEE